MGKFSSGTRYESYIKQFLGNTFDFNSKKLYRIVGIVTFISSVSYVKKSNCKLNSDIINKTMH
jgi:hypothetical protein